jgi:hypothetical protein
LKDPDEKVNAAISNLRLTQIGQVPRREKIRYCLDLGSQDDTDVIKCEEDDIDNVIELFATLNPATS